MNKLTITIAVVALLSGCVSTPTGLHALSTGEETALIESQDGFTTKCTIYGPLPRYSTSTSYMHRSGVVVDAGLVKIMVSCTHTSIFGDSSSKRARFNLVTEAGHTYTFGQQRDCMELLDATADGRVVACEPYYYGGFEIQSTGDDVTTFIHIGDSLSRNRCRVNQEGVGRNVGHLEVDAGPITIHVICEKGLWFKTKKASSFDFIAEAEHTYRFTASKKECMGLLDITFGEQVIACNPYEDVK